MGSTPGKIKSRFREIDRLRGFAILLVIWHHLAISILSPFVRWEWSRTWSGVDLFFVISGFVVTGSMLRLLAEAEDNSARPSSIQPWQTWITFVKRRFVRILPMAWLWGFVPIALSLLYGCSLTELKHNLVELAGVVSFSYNYVYYFTQYHYLGYYWSLAVEEHFYLLLPLIIIFAPGKSRKIRLALFLAIFIFLGRLFLFNPPPMNNVASYHFLSHNRFDSLLVGVLLSLAHENIKLYLSSVKISRSIISLFCYTMCIFIGICPGLDTTDLNVTLGLITLASGCLVFAGSLNKGYVLNAPALGNFIERIGIRSYSLYLIHQPAIWIAQKTGGGFSSQVIQALCQMAIFTVVLAVATELNFVWVENPLVNLSKKINCRSDPELVKQAS